MSETDKTHNGWTNYETWLFALWLDNERGTYEMAREMARGVVAQYAEDLETHGAHDDSFSGAVSGYCRTCGEVARRPPGALADQLKQWASDEEPDLGASIWSDLLGAALSAVNWYEVAEHYLEDVQEEQEQEAE